MLKRFLLSLVLSIAAAVAVEAQCPTLTGPAITESEACIGEVVTLTMSGGTNLVPGAQTVDWYVGSTPGFDPLSQGTFVGSAQIVGAGGGGACSDPPIVLGGLVNPCIDPNNTGTNPGSEENEAFLVWSAGGFDAANFGAEVNNLIGTPGTDDIGVSGSCPLSNSPTVPVSGSCVVYGGPTTVVPPNAFVLIFTSSHASQSFDFSLACAFGFPIYVFQSSCGRGPVGNVAGALTNGFGGPYNLEFGCPGPAQSLSYFGVSGDNSSFAGWTIAGIGLPAPCGGLPAFPPPPPVAVNVTIDPLDVTITANDCGQQYYSAVVAPPVAGCPPQPGVGDLSLFVECPIVTLSGSVTVCAGDPIPTGSLQVTFSGLASPPYTLDYRINGVPQPQITTFDNPYSFQFTPATPGAYSILVDGINSPCQPQYLGSADITALSPSPAMPLDFTACALDQPIDLTQLQDPAAPGGTWTGPNVSGSSFDAGASASGDFVLTYTPPAGGCSTPGTATVTLTAPSSTTLAAPPVLCGPTTYDLNNLLNGSSPTGDWSGPNLTLPSTFNAPPIGGVGAQYVFTYTPTSGCFLPEMVTITVQASGNAMPLDATICATEQPLDLTALEDPAAPGGTWTGPNVTGNTFDAGSTASGNFTITYSPPTGGGSCLLPGTSTVTVNAPAAPTLATATACVSNAPIDLSTLVVGGVPSGTWSGTGVLGGFFDPSSVSTGTYTINFAPTAGSCFLGGSTTIQVVPATNANLGTATLCITDPAFALSGIEDPAYPGGTWSGPGVSGGFFDPSAAGSGVTTITYTPPTGQCAIATNTTITVSNQTFPTLGTATLCLTDPLFDLTTLQDPSFPSGSWSGTGVSGSSFNPSSAGVGNTTLTYTPSGGSCEGPSSTTLVVTSTSTPFLGTTTLCETDPAFDLTTLTDPAFPNGSWSGPGVVGSTFNPGSAGAGSITITFTPSSGSCASAENTTINVTPAGPAQPLNATICASDQPLDLTPFEDPAATGGTWTGANVSGSTFDAGPGASGNFTVTYTPPPGGCSAPGNATITVSASGSPTLGTATVCISDGLYDLFLLQDPAISSGIWTGAGVSGSFFDPTVTGVGTHTITFTPTGTCLNAASTSITVSNAVTPVLAPATLCVVDPPLDLTTLEDPSYPGGVWTGPSVSGGFFNPTTAGTGSFTLTYTVSGGCVNQATTNVTVTGAGAAQPLDATICASDQPLDLTPFEDPAARGGTWSGTNVVGNTFDAGPSASGAYSITYTPLAGGCSLPGTSTITVSAGGTPTLGTATVCISDGLFDLFTIQDPAFSSGTWTGGGVSGSFFDPTITGPGTQTVTFSPTGGCLSAASTTIIVNDVVTPTLSDATVCESDPVFDLTSLEDPAYTGGMWSGPSVTGTSFDPSIGAGSYVLTYTSTGACVADATNTITVTRGGTPVLGTATLCETETIDLTTLQDPAFPSGTWSGRNVIGNTFDAAGLPPGDYRMTFTPTMRCAQIVVTDITVFLAAPTSGRDTILCAGSPAFALDILLDGGPIAGIWSGPGVAAGQFDAPNVASGTYGLTFTPAAGVCALPTTIQVTVQVSGTPTIANQSVCNASPVIDLNALVPSPYGGGTWSGTNVVSNSFDPSAVTAGNYRLVYTPGGPCTNSTTVIVSVSSTIILTLPTLPYCIDAGIIDLSTEDPAAAPGGTWSGPGVSGNQLDPTIPGPGNFTLTYTPPIGGCATDPVSTSLQISPLTAVGIFTDTVCAGSGPIDLSTQLDPSFAMGSWSGSSITSAGVYTPSNTAGPDQITFTPQGGCYTEAQFTFDVVGTSTLSVGQPTFTCAPDGLTYSASLSVTTTPNNGTITTSIGTLVGSILTITGLMSGSVSNVVVDDAATCNPPITLDVSHTCTSINCITDAGNLSGGPSQLCSTEQLINAGVSGFVNDGDDVLFYLLDEDTNPDNGFLDQRANIQFDAPVSLFGQSLFVYALAGSNDGTGGISLVDTCRSQSNALQVIWSAPISASAASPVCNAAQDAFTVEITLMGGTAPYSELNGATGSFISSNVFSAGPFPSGTVLTLSFDDAQNCGPQDLTITHDCSSPCVAPDPGSFDASPLLLCDTYLTDANYNFDAVLGPNDVQMFVVYDDAAGTSELGRFPSLPIDLGSYGITDGFVYVSSLAGENDGSGGISSTCFAESPLRIVRLGQTQFVNFDTTAMPGTTVIIAGTAYNDTNNTGSYTVSGFGASCDTIVNVTVNFRNVVDTTIIRNDVLCNNDTLIIGGQVFTASNPSDTFVVSGAFDTTYQVALDVLPPANFLLRDSLCFGDSLVVGNLVFDQLNTTGTAILRARSGCDSLVTVELEFFRAPEVSFIGAPTYCPGEDVELLVRVLGGRRVQGDLFINGNSVGVTTLPAGDTMFTFPATTDFTFRLSNLSATTSGCAEAMPRQLSYTPAVSQLNADIPLPLAGNFTACNGNTVDAITVQPGDGIGPFSYNWSRGDTTSTILNVGQGMLSVTITDNIGCTSMADVEVVEGDTLPLMISVLDPVCPDGEGNISISLEELPENAQFRFDLPGLDPVTSADFSFDNLEAGTYVFQIIQENGCEQNELITLEDPLFFDIVRFDTVDINLGDSARLFVEIPNALDSIRWLPGEFIDCDTCERVLVSPPFDLEYEAIVFTTEGCEIRDRVFVRVSPLADIFLPTAFSPNGDAVNDRLVPFGGPEVELIESFFVFDRWGNQVYEARDFLPGDERSGWDGIFKGEFMNPAVFVVTAQVRFRNGTVQTFSGDVSLIR
jgi:gliding motility-associated-like protein